MNIECLSGNEYGGFENIFNGAEMIREPRVWYESKKHFLYFYIVFIAVPVDRL